MDEKWINLVQALIELGYDPSGVAHELSNENLNQAESARSEYSRDKFFKMYEKLGSLSAELG
jgi:hypothetical protein